MRISDWSSDVCSSDLTIQTSAGGRPRASQPSSSAPPILPQPTSSSGPPSFIVAGVSWLRLLHGFTVVASGFADGLQHRGLEGLPHRRPAPHHPLPRRLDAVACHQTRFPPTLALLYRVAGPAAPRHRVAAHYRPTLPPP